MHPVESVFRHCIHKHTLCNKLIVLLKAKAIKLCLHKHDYYTKHPHLAFENYTHTHAHTVSL